MIRSDLLALGAVGALALAGARGSRAKAGPTKVLPAELREPVPEVELAEGTKLWMESEHLKPAAWNVSNSKPYLWKGKGTWPHSAWLDRDGRAPAWRPYGSSWGGAWEQIQLPRKAKLIEFNPGWHHRGEGERVFRALTGKSFRSGQDQSYHLAVAAKLAGYDGFVLHGALSRNFDSFMFFDYLDLPRLRRTLSGKRFVTRAEAEPW